MSVSKTVGMGVAGLVLIIIVAAVYLWSSLDSLVEAAIEKYGSQATQTNVAVGGVKLSLTDGKGAIQGLEVGNPPGFSRKNIFSLGEISVAIDPKTVTNDVVVINSISIQSPQVFYEINDQGKSNVDALNSNLQQASSGQSDKQATGDAGDSKEVKLIIREFVINKGEIDARIAALGDKKDLSANLPPIKLTNLGKKTGGATPAQIAEEVVGVLLKKTGKAVAELGVQQYLGVSADEAKASLKAKATEALDEKVGGKLKGLFGN